MQRPLLQRRIAALFLACAALCSHSKAQELPTSGISGFDFVYGTSPAGDSRLFAINAHRSSTPFPLGPIVSSRPSRWAHRRRTLGALETAITSPERAVFLTPMGNAVGNGAIHMVDLRFGVQSVLVPTGNPASYDLAVLKPLDWVFSAHDDGAGHTILRGFSYGTFGALTPLSPASVTIPGSPAAYVNRIGVDVVGAQLHVPTAAGIQIVDLSGGFPNLALGPFIPTGAAAPATNPIRFTRNNQSVWIIGTTRFSTAAVPTPTVAGWLAWTSTGALGSDIFGIVPTNPSKMWVPAVGTEELAIVDNGVDAYVYYLLREPGPGTFFVKPAAVGVVRFIGANSPATSTILMPNDVGEPFSNPAVSGTRIAFESSFGQPFFTELPDGGEKISIIYTPLDPLGSATANGVLGVPDPLGGRINTKGMDRPIWSRDGTRVMAATSHFPGAPNPGVPGIEVLDVPANVPLSSFVGPHTVVSNLPFPNQSIVFPSSFVPRVPGAAAFLDSFSFFGNVYNRGLASIGMLPFGEVGQLEIDPVGFTLPPGIPNFPAILPPAFLDATGSVLPVPQSFGARRTTFNVAPSLGFDGLAMSAAVGDAVYVELAGTNFLAQFGIGTAQNVIRVPLPAGWITTTEFFSF